MPVCANLLSEPFDRNASLRKTCVLNGGQKSTMRRRYGGFGVESGAAEDSPVGRNGFGAVPLCAWPERRVVDLREHNRPRVKCPFLVCQAAGHAAEADPDRAVDTPSVSAKHGSRDGPTAEAG